MKSNREITEKIVVTGGAGRVGTMIRPYLRRQYGNICLIDRIAPTDLLPGETCKQLDMADMDGLQEAFLGARAVVHLAAFLSDEDARSNLETNVGGTFNVFEAARRQQVERVIFASSNHVLGFRRTNCISDEITPPRPDSLYGVSKAFGEALASLYADKHGMRCLSIRIGNVGPRPLTLRGLSIWVHPEDLTNLFAIGVEHPDIHSHIFYGVSSSSRSYYSNKIAEEFGYSPAHCSDSYYESIAQDPETNDYLLTPGSKYQGGPFTEREFDGDWARTYRTQKNSAW